MKTTFEIIQVIICALLLINIGIMIAASLDRKSRRYAKEVIRETLRMKMLASRDLGKYALYVSPSCVKVALAGDHQLALLSGMNDFWGISRVRPFPLQSRNASMTCGKNKNASL